MMPFAGGIESLPNGTLILSVGAAFFYLGMLGNAPSLKRSAVKTLGVALLALLAFVQGGPPLLVAALLASAVGDALLSHDGDRAFLGGLAAFLVAHLLYVGLFISAGEGFGLAAQPARALIGVVMVFATAALLLRLRSAAPPAMKAPVTAYGLAILAMGLSALTVPGAWIAVGALSFMASDAMLGIERFLHLRGAVRTLLRRAVWLSYYAAQAIITLGFLAGGAGA